MGHRVPFVGYGRPREKGPKEFGQVASSQDRVMSRASVTGDRKRDPDGSAIGGRWNEPE